MKLKNISLIFSLATILSTVLRILQLYFTIDEKTGFFKMEFKTYGVYILLFIGLSALITVIFAFTAYKSPQNMPKGNALLGLLSFLGAFSIVFEVFGTKKSLFASSFLTTLLTVTGLAAALFFICFAVKNFKNLDFPNLLYCLPCVYLIVKVIYEFSAISSLAIISDNILLIAAYCSLMIFFLQFAKVYTNNQTERDFRKLLASGMLSILLCITQSVGYFTSNILLSMNNNHTSLQANISILVFGLYTGVFLLSYFRTEK